MRQTLNNSPLERPVATEAASAAAMPPPAEQVKLPRLPSEQRLPLQQDVLEAFGRDPLNAFLDIRSGKYGLDFDALRDKLLAFRDPVMSIAKGIDSTPSFNKIETDSVLAEASAFFDKKLIPASWPAHEAMRGAQNAVVLDPKKWSLNEVDTLSKQGYEKQQYEKSSEILLGTGLSKAEVTFSTTAQNKLETFWRINAADKGPVSIVLHGPDGAILHTHVLRETEERFARLTLPNSSEGKYTVEIYPYDVSLKNKGTEAADGRLRRIPIRTEFLLFKQATPDIADK